MITTLSVSQAGVTTMQKITSLDGARDSAIKKFKREKDKGVILSEYTDDSWLVTDQQNRYTIRFDVDREEMISLCQKKGKSYEEYVDALKIYAILRLGTCTLANLVSMTTYIVKKTRESDYYRIYKALPSNCYKITLPTSFADFVELISPESKDYINKINIELEQIRARGNERGKGDNQAVLNEFSSYFKFDDLIRRWWAEDHAEKYYYFPLYLFWVLTTVLPLRVTEFCLTPFDCISRKDEKYYITIRRTKLKGNSDDMLPKIRWYMIDKDYQKNTYEIPRWLYDLIDQYKGLTAKYHRNHELLFSVEYVYSFPRYEKKKKTQKETIFSDEILGKLLKDFYYEVVVGEYGLCIVSEKELMARYEAKEGEYKLSENEIMLMQSKHTRHLALINLVMAGANPMTIKDFAGHESCNMSAHYYTNMSNIVRCVTKTIYDFNKSSGKVNAGTSISLIDPRALLIEETDDCVQMDNGRCYSVNFLSGDIGDCKKCGGECANCEFFIPEKTEKKSDNPQIDEECAYIVKMLKDPKIEEKITEYQIGMKSLQRHIAIFRAKILQEEEDARQKKI